MRFDLSKPCPDCPFRRDCLRGWLGAPRAEEIADALLGRPGKSFACHQTTQFDEEGEHRQHEAEQQCVGAMILVEKTGAANQMLQVAERLGVRDPGRISEASRPLVFDTRAEFIEHHTAPSTRSGVTSRTGSTDSAG